jgi:molybdopterin biosynthesis enzyme
VRIAASVDGMHITPIAWQGSGDLASAAQADGFVVVPMDAEPRAGATAAVLLIG